jgi:hypothetical protein
VTRRLTCVVLSLLAVLGLAVAASPSATAGPPIWTLKINGLHVIQGDHSVPPGASVRVINQTASTQTLTAKVDGVFRPGIFTTGNIPPSSRGSFIAPEQIGKYHFGSAYHPHHRGNLYVRRTAAIRAPAAQTVPAGSDVQFVTKLVDRETGEPIVGATVYLEVHFNNQRPAFEGILSRTTGPTGHAAGVDSVRATNRYRWVFPGNAQYVTASSKAATITVE